MNSIESLAFVFPLRAGKTQEWRAWIREILGPRRSEYGAFSRKLGLKMQRAYLQQTPHGDQVIIYLEEQDLQRTVQQLQTSQDPFAVWGRQRIQDLFDGVDLTQTDLGSLSQFVFDGPSADEDEAHSHARKVMEQLGMIRP
jgi:hypothetical protein